MQYANPTTMIWALVFVGFRPKLGQSLDLKYSEQLITTCLCKDDWTVRTSLTTAVHCGGSCTRHMFPAIRCKNLRSSCITLQYNVLQHLDTCCEQLTTVTTPKMPMSRMMLMQRRTLYKLSHLRSNLQYIYRWLTVMSWCWGRLIVLSSLRKGGGTTKR